MDIILIIGFALLYFVGVVLLEVFLKVRFNKKAVMLVFFVLALLIFLAML
ncbi:MAG: hypothetical protein ACK5L5_06590 [Bacteroidales bacterium]